jgi:hypothetical protein
MVTLLYFMIPFWLPSSTTGVNTLEQRNSQYFCRLSLNDYRYRHCESLFHPLKHLYEVCSESSQNDWAEQQCIGRVSCSLCCCASWPLVTLAILFKEDRTFRLSLCNQFCDLVCCPVTFGTESVTEQRTWVKFCFIAGETVAETHSMLCEVYSDDATSQTTT